MDIVLDKLDSVLPSSLKNGVLDKLLPKKVSPKIGMDKEAGVDSVFLPFDIYTSVFCIKLPLRNELYSSLLYFQ